MPEKMILVSCVLAMSAQAVGGPVEKPIVVRVSELAQVAPQTLTYTSREPSVGVIHINFVERGTTGASLIWIKTDAGVSGMIRLPTQEFPKVDFLSAKVYAGKEILKITLRYGDGHPCFANDD